ncbi:MAG TPA: branched-chain amino acid ABC transporter permease [Acidimicrobiales bacterium]|nr:branched-chain amino acid ABC transporter permease [Acidimicrobiales bacterium]
MNWSGILESSLEAMVTKNAVVFALAAIGLNIHYGYTGLLNFGQAGFMAAGAYGTGIAITQWSWPIFPAALFGIALSILLALALGLPTLRLRADYLAIVTIAAAEIIRRVVKSTEYRGVTGGSGGLNGIAEGYYDANPFSSRLDLGIVDFSAREQWFMLTGWGVVVLCMILTYLLVRSPWGRVLKAIREDEDAVRSLGKNVTWYKMQSLILGGVFGALGGIMLTLEQQSVQPDQFFTPTTFFAFTALILGGAGRVFGPVVGAMLFWGIVQFTDVFLRQAIRNDLIPDSIMDGVQAGQVRFIIAGALLAGLMIFRQQGLFGNKREVALDDR